MEKFLAKFIFNDIASFELDHVGYTKLYVAFFAYRFDTNEHREPHAIAAVRMWCVGRVILRVRKHTGAFIDSGTLWK
jgi:hypothetical protein